MNEFQIFNLFFEFLNTYGQIISTNITNIKNISSEKAFEAI